MTSLLEIRAPFLALRQDFINFIFETKLIVDGLSRDVKFCAAKILEVLRRYHERNPQTQWLSIAIKPNPRRNECLSRPRNFFDALMGEHGENVIRKALSILTDLELVQRRSDPYGQSRMYAYRLDCDRLSQCLAQSSSLEPEDECQEPEDECQEPQTEGSYIDPEGSSETHPESSSKKEREGEDLVSKEKNELARAVAGHLPVNSAPVSAPPPRKDQNVPPPRSPLEEAESELKRYPKPERQVVNRADADLPQRIDPSQVNWPAYREAGEQGTNPWFKAYMLWRTADYSLRRVKGGSKKVDCIELYALGMIARDGTQLYRDFEQVYRVGTPAAIAAESDPEEAQRQAEWGVLRDNLQSWWNAGDRDKVMAILKNNLRGGSAFAPNPAKVDWMLSQNPDWGLVRQGSAIVLATEAQNVA